VARSPAGVAPDPAGEAAVVDSLSRIAEDRGLLTGMVTRLMSPPLMNDPELLILDG
jgi:hypothetical protein